MSKKNPKDDELFPTEETSSTRRLMGKDELNLAEFPLSALSSRIPKGMKTLEFSDQIFDKGTRQLVKRKLTITASDKFGLPTAMDDEIILALLQLSKMENFQNKKVTFSKYEIVKLLDWRDTGDSYKRVAEGLDRWLGVTLKYQNAWWNAEEQAWMTEGFHIIERLTTAEDSSGKKRDAFVWNDVVFQSFQAGYLKSIDLDVYQKLKGAIAKRLYRLLDKRFYRTSKVEFDLVELAFNKLGVSKNYAIGNLKQKLNPAIKELEKAGFIKKASSNERYLKIRVGVWHIIFYKGSGDRDLLEDIPDESELEIALMRIGVTKTKARRLVAKFPPDFIRHKIEVIDFLMAKEEPPKNPAGYLVKSIEETYSDPTGFLTEAERRQEEEEMALLNLEKKRKREQKEALAQTQRDQELRVEAEKAKAVDIYLKSLSEEEKKKTVKAAHQQARDGGDDWIDKDSVLGEHSRQTALENYILPLVGYTEKQSSPEDLWQEVCMTLEKEVGEGTYKDWFEGITMVSCGKGKLILQTDFPDKADWIRSRWLDLIQQHWILAGGATVKISIS